MHAHVCSRPPSCSSLALGGVPWLESACSTILLSLAPGPRALPALVSSLEVRPQPGLEAGIAKQLCVPRSPGARHRSHRVGSSFSPLGHGCRWLSEEGAGICDQGGRWRSSRASKLSFSIVSIVWERNLGAPFLSSRGHRYAWRLRLRAQLSLSVLTASVTVLRSRISWAPAIVSWKELLSETSVLLETVPCWGFLHSWTIYTFESAKKNAILLAKDGMF